MHPLLPAISGGQAEAQRQLQAADSANVQIGSARVLLDIIYDAALLGGCLGSQATRPSHSFDVIFACSKLARASRTRGAKRGANGGRLHTTPSDSQR
jgi:hypothetical protein